VKYAIECVYILNDKYAPYYKWQFKGMNSLDILPDISDILIEIINTNVKESAMIQLIEKVCDIIVSKLNELGLSSVTDSFLEIQKNEVLKQIDE
jgi:hypothetical protein